MEEKKYYVYKHTFPNNKVYIGITRQEPEKRWKNGLGYNAHQPIMKRAIKKYGWQNIKHEILFENLTKEQACKKEIELITLYDSTNKQKGYNVSQGGEGTIGVKPTIESKEKNRIAHLGKKASLETRKKISEAQKGKHINGKLSKPVLQIKKDTNEIITEFPSTIEVQRQLGISQSHISDCCKGKRKTCGGFKWQYK